MWVCVCVFKFLSSSWSTKTFLIGFASTFFLHNKNCKSKNSSYRPSPILQWPKFLSSLFEKKKKKKKKKHYSLFTPFGRLRFYNIFVTEYRKQPTSWFKRLSLTITTKQRDSFTCCATLYNVHAFFFMFSFQSYDFGRKFNKIC